MWRPMWAGSVTSDDVVPFTWVSDALRGWAMAFNTTAGVDYFIDLALAK